MGECTMIWAGVLFLKEKKVLMVREEDKDFFVFPGGRLDENETSEVALRRELLEELNATAGELSLFGEYDLPGRAEGTLIHFILYTGALIGEFSPSGDIVEMRWVDSEYPKEGLQVGHLASMHVLGDLKTRGLIS